MVEHPDTPCSWVYRSNWVAYWETQSPMNQEAGGGEDGAEMDDGAER